MGRAVGIFFIIHSLLTYLIIHALHASFKVKDEIIVTDLDTGITTVSDGSPSGIYLLYIIPIATFVSGLYCILEKRRKEKKVRSENSTFL